MARWESGARERLQRAALELYAERGFEQTTVADIADAVGLSERTFFRHFADKREVLFDGQEVLQEAFVSGVRAAPDGRPPLEQVMSAIDRAVDGFFVEERRDWSRRRQTVIDANPGLAERELLKMGVLSAAVAGVLRERGVPEPAATLAAESGVTVFRVAFAAWVAPDEVRTLVELQHEVLARLVEVSGGTPAPPHS